MVQKVSSISAGLSSQFKNIEETCSCTKCDSLFCFSKRHFIDSCSCSCKNCKESKTCLFFTNRLVRVNESRSNATSTAPISGLTSATGDNAHSYSKYTSQHKVESTKSIEAGITSKQPSKTLAVAHKHPSAIRNKQPSHTSELGQKVFGASETGFKAIYDSIDKKPYVSSLNAIKKELSEVKQSSCCVEPLQSAILSSESHACGHHLSTKTCKVPEQISCVSQEIKPPSSSGYVLELTPYKSTNSRSDTCEVMCVDNNRSKTKNTSSAKNTEDYICDESSAECKLAKLAPDSPGYIFNLKNKNPCDCNESSKDVSEPPHDLLEPSGYILDLTEGSYKQTKNPLVKCKNILTNQINAIKALCNTCLPQTNPMICNEGASDCKSVKLEPDSPGYIFDVKNKKPCDCNETQEKTQTPCCKEDDSKNTKSAGYVFDVPKPYDKYNKPKQNDCECNKPKVVSDPPGYTYDLKKKNSCDCNVPKIMSDPPGYIYVFKQRLKLQRKTTCDCKPLPDNLSYPPGCVYIIPSQKPKDESKHGKHSKNIETVRLKLQRKTTCDCTPLPDNLSYPPGNVHALPSQKSKDQSKHHHGKQSNNAETATKKYLPDADPCSNCSDNTPEPTKHTFNLCVNGPGKNKKQNQKNDCSCYDSHKIAPKLSKSISESQRPSAYKLELCKNILAIQKNAIETLDNLCLLQKKCCDFSTNQTEPPESNTEKKYSQEPVSIKQQLCANILQTQLNAVGILHDVTCAAHESMGCSHPCNEQQDHIKSFNCTEASQNTCEKNRQKFLINFVETNRNGFQSLKSLYKKTACECNNKNSPGYIIELDKSKEDPTIKTNENTNNTSQKKKCDCEESRKRLSNSAGYILELDQYRHEPMNKTRKLSKNLFDVQSNIESLNNTNLKKGCECSEPQKTLSGSAGYTLELQQHTNLPTNTTQRFSNIQEVQGDTIDSLNNTCHKSCDCKKPSKIISDPPGYILELDQNNDELTTKTHKLSKNIFGIQKDAIESLTNPNQKKNCGCSESRKILSSSAVYISELEQIKKKLMTASKKIPKPIDEKENPSDMPNYTCHKTCVCRKPSQIISDPPGYILELDQNKQEQAKNKKNKCKCSQENKELSDSAPEMLTNTHKKFDKDSPEIKIDTTCRKSCGCGKPSQNISDPPGYVLELEQYKQEREKNENNKCKCSQEKKNSPNSALDLHEFARQLSNFPKKISEDTHQMKTDTTCRKSCVCGKPSQIISDPPGYVLELEQNKQERVKNESNKCKCSQEKKNSPNSTLELQEIARQLSNFPKKISENTHEIKTDTTCRKSCGCGKPSQNISDPPGYVLELEQYKQEREKNENDKCKCSQEKKNSPNSALELQDIARQLSNFPRKISEDTHQIKTDTTCRKSCVCRKPSQIISDPPGYIFDLEKYNQESTNKTHIVGKNIFEIQRNTIETLNNANHKKSCACSDSRNGHSSAGYILGLQQYGQAPSNTLRLSNNTQERILGKNNFEIQRSLNDANQKNSCAGKESQKRFSSSAGYILDLELYKTEAQANADDSQSETCTCKDSPNKTFDPIACCVGDMKPNEKRFKRNIYEATLNPSDISDSCNCSKPLENPFESPDKLYNDLRKIQGPTKNALEVCKNIFGTHMNTYDELDHTNQKPCCDYILDGQRNTKETLNDPAETCNCNQNENYIFEIPKTSKVTLNDAKETFNLDQTSKSAFNLPEFLISLHKHVPTLNILEMCKNILDNQDNLNEKHESSKKVQDDDCSCNNKNKSASPKTKNEYTITTQGSKLENQKNTFDLCNQLGAPNSAIQKLKNIYLPPRYTLEYTKNYEYPENNIPVDQSVKGVHSVRVSYSRTEGTGTAKLSAEVMDLPYTEFHDSLAHKQEDITEEANKLTKNDIFKRIKEAYKACSCKICECIIGKSTTKNQICKCRPCECSDCTSYLDKMSYKSPAARISHGSNSSRVRCSKGHYKVVEQQTFWQTCDCKPCDCVKCTHLAQPCDCEPCQCAVCQRQKKVHKSRTLVVAPVGESVQRLSCTCSPCDCIECGQGFPATSRMTNEMSTATNRHALCRCEVCLNDLCEQGGVDFCRCERQKGVINKPVEKDTHDYDIRTASVVYKSQIKKDKNKLCSRHDTIAMFAALPFTFPTFAAKNKPSTTKTCICEECECVSCICKENTINLITSSQLFPSNKSPFLSNYNVHNKSKLNSPQNCNCSKCECEICDKYLDPYNDSNVSTEQKKNCMCNVCGCINCAGESKVIKYSFHGLCQCSTCQCTDCEIKMISGTGHKYQCSKSRYENCFKDKFLSNQIVHPIKRGELLTPSTHRSKVRSLMLEKQRRALPIQTNKCGTLKCDTYKQCQESNRGTFFPKNNSIDNKISGSTFSGYSSFETSLKTSCHKDYDSLTPISQIKNQSLESSCNSSGHDYPEYLIRFPKSTVENCLKDVMKLNMDKIIALDKFNIVPNKSSVKYQADSMSNEFMSEKDNSSQNHGCNLISSCNCETETAKYSESINQYHKVSNSCMGNNRFENTPWEPDFLESTSCRNCKFEIKYNNTPGALESLQTSELSHHNCSGCIEESASSITETKTETKKCFHSPQNFNDVHVACEMLDCKTSEQKPANTLLQIKNEECCTCKYSKPLPHGNIGGDVDTLNSDEDYTRVQKTLKKAKEYNAELMQMLQMYEKANEEFKSISDKLHIPQVLVSKDVVEIEDELQEIPLESHSVREVLTSTSILQESIKPDRTFAECENDFNIITKKDGRTELTIVSDHETCNLPKGECDLTNKLSTTNDIIPLKENEIYLEKSELYFVNKNVPINQNGMYPDEAEIEGTGNYSKHSVCSKKSIDTKPKDKRLIYDNRDSTLDCRAIKKKDRINGKNYKKYSKLLKRTIIISKRITLKNSNLETPNPIVKCCVTEGTSTAEINTNCNNEINFLPSNTEKESNDSYEYNNQRNSESRENVILSKLDSVFGSEEISVSTSDTYGLGKDFMSLNESESSSMAQAFEEIKPWPILKKNHYKSKPNTKNKGVCIFPSLELQIKQAVQSISLQTSSTITPKKKLIISNHENKALAKLQDEVKKLLDMPLLQLQTTSTCRDNTKESLNIQPKNKLELELKETPGISFQTSWKDVKSVDKEVWCSFTREAVESLINDLLHLSVMTPLEKRNDVVNTTTDFIENNRELPGIMTPKCSCDALKVGFLGVRRVSDHTVLVKWNVPQKIAMVHGYELLVDGRAVQKIFSPTKSMAVVTCLPHTDKVLLTIRTITSSLAVTGHYPATTIIYRPRAKY